MQLSLSLCSKDGSGRPEVLYKTDILENFAKLTGKHLCHSPFFNKAEACNFLKERLLTQVSSCEFGEIFKNTLFYRTPLVTASAKKSDLVAKKC